MKIGRGKEMSIRTTLSSMLIIVMAIFITGCSEENVSSGNDGKIQAVSTIGMISDIVANVGGEHVESKAIMGPGVDPHLYKASQGDISKLDKADIIFYNGLGLEGKMSDMFVKMASQKPTVQVTEYVEETNLHKPEEFDGHYDPHLWFDVQLWMKAVERVRDGLIELDPKHESDYKKNAENYLTQLSELDAYGREQLASIPKESRVLVTAHDAFGYMGSAYEMEVMALQGISTDAELV
jgi:manganese/zinc/iron transport system substrate-binding protein